MRNITFRAIITFIVSFLVIGFLSYFILSSVIDKQEISFISSYMEVVVGLGSLILAFIIAYISQKDSEHKPEITVSLTEAAVFRQDKFIDSVKISNISNILSKNIIVRFKYDRNGNYSKWVSCFSLKDGDKHELEWLRFPDTVQVAFTNQNEKKYFKYTYQDLHGITDEIHETEYKTYLQEAIANRNNNTLHLRDKFNAYLNNHVQNKALIQVDYLSFIKPLIFL